MRQVSTNPQVILNQDEFNGQWREAWINMFEEELNGEEEEEAEEVTAAQEQGRAEEQEQDVEEEQQEEAAEVDEEVAEQEQEEEEPLPNIMSQDSPLRLKLTHAETNWALEIKDAMELIPEIDNINDFWVAQYALICKDNVDDAVERVEALQAFRQEYRITDSYQEGCRALQKFTELLPNYIIGWFFNEERGNYVGAVDVGGISATPLNTVEKVDQFFVGYYYIFQAMFPDLESVRKGCDFVVECGVMPNTTRKDYALVTRMFQELFSVYPMTGSFKNYNSGVVFNYMFTVLRMILPKELRKRIEVGLQCEGGLHRLFLVPDAQTAAAQVLLNLKENLRRRYQSENSFALP